MQEISRVRYLYALYNSEMWITFKKRKSQQSHQHDFADQEMFSPKTKK